MWLETILTLLFLGALIVFIGHGLITNFGHPVIDGWYSKCPSCGTDTLRPLDAGFRTAHGAMRGRFSIYRCEKCGKGYRAQLDGSLCEMTD